jgi:hypothetical protein
MASVRKTSGGASGAAAVPPAAEPEILTKSAYARHCGVSPGAVTQWITAGKISGDALVDHEGKEQIRVEVADRQIAERLDPGQKMRTDLGSRVPSTADAEYKRIKTARARIELENAQVEQRQRDGLYTLTREAKAEMNRAVAHVINVIDGALPGWAEQLAAEVDAEPAVILRALRQCYRATRASAADNAKAKAGAVPQFIAVEEEPFVEAAE